MNQKRALKRVVIGITIFVITIIVTFFIYVNSYYKSSSIAMNALESDSIVEVEEDGDIIFTPVSNDKNIGLIIYPGAKVEALAYAPIAKEIASEGYTVVIAKMRFNLAILSPNRADSIIDKYEDIDTWVIGGHSLGGVMAADYAFENDEIKGLVLLASYPNQKDFSNKQIKVLSLWGDNDYVADLNKVKEAKKFMPNDSEFIEIKGGNHGGFGDYGHQKGDGEAYISNKEQMSDTAKYIIKLLENLK